MKNLYNKGIEYKIEIRGKESPIIKNKSIEHCYYDISPIDNKSDYWNYCCKRLACSKDINVVTMPLQSLGT